MPKNKYATSTSDRRYFLLYGFILTQRIAIQDGTRSIYEGINTIFAPINIINSKSYH